MREPIERVALPLGRCKRQVLLPREHFAGVLEQPHIVPLDRAQMAEQRFGEVVATGKAEKPRKLIEGGRIGRQCVGLLVGNHLQAVFDAAEKLVGGGQFVARGGVDPAADGERAKGRDRFAPTQLGVASAGDELLRLHEKFDLADAATAELDIVTLDSDLAMAAIRVDLLLHRVHVGDGRVVEIFAPDKGREIAQELFAGGQVTGAWPRLDQRRSLPVLSPAFIIFERGFARDRDLGRGRIGAQPQIDAKDVTVGCPLLQQLHKIASEPHVKRCRFDVRGA